MTGDGLRQIIVSFLAGETDTGEFCRRFEEAFNFEADKAALSEQEYGAYERLFNEVVYYSPFPEERAVIPNYRGEAQIRAAAEACLQAI